MIPTSAICWGFGATLW